VPSAPADRAADAQRRVDSLLAQLREHQAEQHQMDAAAWKAERDRLERAAASAMRERDAVAAVPAGGATPKGKAATPPAAPTGFFGRHPQLAGAAWGGGVVLFFGALVLLLSQEQKPRGTNDTATGTVGGGTEAAPADGEDRDFQTALTRVRENPGADLNLTAEVARELIGRNEFQQAEEVNDRALAVDPFRTDLRIHRAFLQVTHGDRQAGMETLGKLADLYPEGGSALIFRGMVHMQFRETREALADFEEYLAVTPAQNVPPQLRAGIAQLRQQVTGAR
jgi:tetratricopeptide (TPR) repeat protein